MVVSCKAPDTIGPPSVVEGHANTAQATTQEGAAWSTPTEEVTERFIDLQVISWAENSMIQLYHVATGARESIPYDAHRYGFAGTYGNGAFILLNVHEPWSQASYWFTKDLALIGYSGSQRYSNGTSFYTDFPDSDRRYVTSEVWQYAMSALNISDFELVLSFPYPLTIHQDKTKAYYVYDELQRWFNQQESEPIIEIMRERIGLPEVLPSGADKKYIQVTSAYLASESFKEALMSFIAFYGTTRETEQRMRGVVEAYDLPHEGLLQYIALFNDGMLSTRSPTTWPWRHSEPQDTYYRIQRTDLGILILNHWNRTQPGVPAAPDNTSTPRSP